MLQLWVDVLDIPVHGVAVEAFLQAQPLRHVPRVQVPGQGHRLVEVLQPVVQPDQGCTLGVLEDLHGVHLVGVLRAEDVAHVRAGHHLDAAPAAPSPQRHLDVLTAPLRHVGVVGAHPLPVVPPDSEDATGQRWRGVRVWISVRMVPLLDQIHPVESQRPIEASNVVVRSGVFVKVVLGDDVQSRHDQECVLLRGRELLEQRLQPLLAHDAVGLHEEEHGAVDQRRPNDLGADEALALLVAVDADLGVERPQAVVVLPLLGVPVVDEEDLVDQLQRGVREEGPDSGADLQPGLVEVWDDQGGPRQCCNVELGVDAPPVANLRWHGEGWKCWRGCVLEGTRDFP
mmetsp:Transcript_138355/g.336275  ORF Transcript_138355/g.336275 Transcript_138355/m.336275 type:complete len:343 (-) Transcript_138355:203-1231(-)